MNSLTLRERQVLKFLAQGMCDKEIATMCFIQLGTVKAHVRAILSKLEATNRTQAVVVAIGRGLIHVELRAAPQHLVGIELGTVTSQRPSLTID